MHRMVYEAVLDVQHTLIDALKVNTLGHVIPVIKSIYRERCDLSLLQDITKIRLKISEMARTA